MTIRHLNIGIMHSLIGKNDGVSIVIDQTVNAMVKDMGIRLGSIFFLAAHSSPRFNAETNEIFWHKNAIHKRVIKHFGQEAPDDLDEDIHQNALYAKEIIAKFVDKHEIDLLIAHNTSHPYNFITAVGLGYYIEELREQGIIWPKIMVWWHDSYFERALFANPNPVIDKYLKYLPGTYVDAIGFINKTQPDYAKRLFKKYNKDKLSAFFKERTSVIPNTSEITWDWQEQAWHSNRLIAPPPDNYNDSFFQDIGLIDEIGKRGFDLDNTVILLQHTRVVPRKKIELAIDFAFELEKRFLQDDNKKCIALLVSGHSGDEQSKYKEFLGEYYQKKIAENPNSNVVFIFGEAYILSHREIIVDKKYYNFAEIPAIIAGAGGMGTYFSEVEGYGNNLLEMASFGLPVVINKYEIYQTDIEPLGFDFPAITDCQLNNEVIEIAYMILVDYRIRNSLVFHNLSILHKKLDHQIIGKKLSPLIKRMFRQQL